MSCDRAELLEPDERAVEFRIRNIDPEDDMATIKLVVCWTEEQKDSRLVPKKSHVSSDGKIDEFKLCLQKANSIQKTNEKFNVDTPLALLQTSLTRITHWYDRANRAKNTFGELENIIKTIGKLRRSHQVILGYIEAQVSRTKASNAENNDISDPTGMNEYADPIDSITSQMANSEISQIAIADNGYNADNHNPADNADIAYNFVGNGRAVASILKDIPSKFIKHAQRNSDIHFGAIPKGSKNSYRPEELYNPEIKFNNPVYRSTFAKGILNQDRDNKLQSLINSHNNAPNFKYNDCFRKPKWNVPKFSDYLPNTKFDKTLNVRDFVFQLETMAMLNSFPIRDIHRIIFNYIEGAAQAWLLSYIRKNPNCTWHDIKGNFISRFSDPGGTEEERLQLQQRQQGSTPINDFILEMDARNNRLTNPFSEAQLLRIVQTNLNSTLRTHTMLHHFSNIEELRIACFKFECHWAKPGPNLRKNETPKFVRQPQIQEMRYWNYEPIHNELEGEENESQQENFEYTPPIQNDHEISILSPQDNTQINHDVSLQHLRCWNCKKQGHMFKNCKQLVNRIFCFGCGKDNVIKPYCLNCKQNVRSGNQVPNLQQAGVQRSGISANIPRQQNFHPTQILKK